jgi:hypothetical protein
MRKAAGQDQPCRALAVKVMKSDRSYFPGFLVVLLLGGWILYQATPISIREGEWTQRVVRNWREFGFFNLHGKMAYNVAGEGLPAHPLVYAGHRPVCLYPACLASWVFGGENCLAFHLLASLAVGLGTWYLLGSGSIGMLAALLVVFAPGYSRMTALLDPLDVPVLLGIPFLCGMRRLLGREKLSLGGLVLVAGLVAVCASLNWTAIMALGITTAFLAAVLPGKFRRVLVFALICAAAGGLVLVISLLSKKGPSTPSAAGPSGLVALFNNYLFGPGGYGGHPMNWVRAVMRIGSASAVSLLPLWVLFFILAWRSFRRRAKSVEAGLQPASEAASLARGCGNRTQDASSPAGWKPASTRGADWALLRPLWPLLMALLFVFGMRNYFAAHPWMAGPVLVCGIVFSLSLMLDCEGRVPEDGGQRRLGLWLAVAGAFLYGLVILFFLQANGAGEDALLRLVRTHTDRHDRIFLSPGDDPWMAKNAGRIADLTDRLILPLPSPGEQPPETSGPGQSFRLTTKASTNDSTRVASTSSNSSTPVVLMRKMVRWYQSHVVKREKGDQFDIEQALYLYKMP